MTTPTRLTNPFALTISFDTDEDAFSIVWVVKLSDAAATAIGPKISVAISVTTLIQLRIAFLFILSSTKELNVSLYSLSKNRERKLGWG